MGVHPSRVRHLLDKGEIKAEKISGRWVVDSAAAENWRQRRAGYAGRPLEPSRAWALLFDLSGDLPDWLDAGELWKLRHARAANDLSSLVVGARLRARRREFRAHPSDLPRISDDPGFMRSGLSAASGHELDLVGSDVLEGYVSQEAFERLNRRFRLMQSERPNLILRVLPNGCHVQERRIAPKAAVILDLFESGEPRAVSAARRAWWKLPSR